MKTEWNYSELAKPYLNRPAYSKEALEALFLKIAASSQSKVCDVGAGVAHLTIPLLEKGFIVDAVEPNDEMRALGKGRTNQFPNVTWYEGTGEETGREQGTYDIVTFGSSFNVTDRSRALEETNRILKSKGWFACMWNHRDLEDEIQKSVEQIIKKHVPHYDYGTRREDQTSIIVQCGLFDEVHFVEGNVSHTVNKTDWVDAWRSHATLARQASDKFDDIVNEIESYIKVKDGNELIIPYTTRIWFSQKVK